MSAAVSAGKTTIDKAYDVPVLGEHLDFINVMTYDIHGYWDHKTGHHAPLFQHADDDADYKNVVSIYEFNFLLFLELIIFNCKQFLTFISI